MRLDIFLQKKYPDFTRSFFKKLISAGKVRVSGKVVTKPHCNISETAALFVDFPEDEAPEKTGASSWKILYEDRSICVIDKPPHCRVEDLIEEGSGLRLVHRLDKGTSGVLVIAKNERICSAMQKQWQGGSVKKTYVALIKGILKPRKGAIEAPIMRSFRDRKKMAVSSSSKARKAFTEYKVLEYFPSLTLVEAYPKTGRTHQIRVHFSSIGHPVLGDPVYGDPKINRNFAEKGLNRQFLHATRLEFSHPTTKKRLIVESGLPEDLSGILKDISS